MLGKYAFTKKQRLLVRADFDRVFQEAIKFKSRYVTFFVRMSSLGARLGIIVTKKNVPRAVDRNRVKRMVRETFRQYQTGLPGEVVVVAHKGIGQLSTSILRGILEKEWIKILSSS